MQLINCKINLILTQIANCFIYSHTAANPHFCSFASFLAVLLTYFINEPDSIRDLIIFTSCIFSFEIIVFIPDTKIFLGIPVFAAVTAANNPNVVKTLLGNGLSFH